MAFVDQINVPVLQQDEIEIERAKAVLVKVCIRRLIQLTDVLGSASHLDTSKDVWRQNADIRREASRIIYLTKFF